CLESVTVALSAAGAFSSLARLRNTKPKGTGYSGLDHSPVGNDPATPDVCKGTEGTLCPASGCVTVPAPGDHLLPAPDGEEDQSSLGMSASVPEQCGNGCRARTVGSVADL